MKDKLFVFLLVSTTGIVITTGLFFAAILRIDQPIWGYAGGLLLIISITFWILARRELAASKNKKKGSK